jgi:hypothetical protein
VRKRARRGLRCCPKRTGLELFALVAPGLRTCDHTVRTEYERALDLAKSHIGGLPTTGPQLPITDVTGAQLEGLTSDQITAHRRLLPASPPRKARARMPTSASTAPAFTPTPHTW